MTTYTKSGKTKIHGVVKIIYKKIGSTKQYVQYKGKHIGLLKYKTIMKNKMQNGTKRPSAKRHSSMKMGGYFNTEETSWGMNDTSGSFAEASNGISGSLADASSGASGAASGVAEKTGGKCRKVKKCKKVKSGKNKGKRVCRKACK